MRANTSDKTGTCTHSAQMRLLRKPEPTQGEFAMPSLWGVQLGSTVRVVIRSLEA